MSNIVALRRPHFGRHTTVSALTVVPQMFAVDRRARDDAFWLKENAEILQILAATRTFCDISCYVPVARKLFSDLQFFPQYYRMFLSIGLDLHALGLPNVPVADMAAYVLDEGLAEAEVSDIHRSEAQLLLARAGMAADDAGLQARLAHFTAQSARFAVPNLRAAYDLTHVVFHAADYGRQTLTADADRTRSLIHAGIVAFLDDNMDLLAEVTIALRLSGGVVPTAWDAAVASDLARFSIEADHGDAAPDDDYHAWLVQSWAGAVANGGQVFGGHVPQGARLFRAQSTKTGTLRALSLALIEMGEARRPDWAHMRWRIASSLTAPQRAHLAAVQDLPEFEGFFTGFSRCGPRVSPRSDRGVA